MTKYRGLAIEPMGETFLVHTGGMYGYQYFKTVEAAKKFIDEVRS